MFDVVNKSFFVVIFIAVWLVGWDFPSGGVGVDIEFSEFVFNADLLEFGLWWNFIAKGHGIIKNTET